MRYTEYQQLNLPAIGGAILKKWEETHAFEKSIDLREGKKPFIFYEGPPSANGMPGIHHVISRTLKDLVCRYKTMQGFQVKRKGGWDTHGLPIELSVEKLLKITKEDIGKKISVEEYNATCRKEVLRYKDKWNAITRQMGYWVDLDHPYITFENNYIETLWWCLKELYNRKLLYEDVSIQPYSPAAGTGLSSHELNQPGTYKDVKDTSCVAMFRSVKNDKASFLYDAAKTGELFFLAWTTTPWTLPSNLGLTVGANIDYVLVRTFNPYSGKPCAVILAKDLLHKYFPEHIDEWEEGNNNELYEAIINWLDKSSDKNIIEQNSSVLKVDFDNLVKKKQLPYKIVLQCKGSQIEYCEYEQLMPFESNAAREIEVETPNARPFRVITGDFVTTEEGTGIVHTAPAFGADDFKAGKKNNLGILTLVDREGKFVKGVGEFSGRYVKNYKDELHYTDVNVDICVKLKKENRAFKIEKFEHSYPHCWRTDKPIIYYPLDAWFIKTTAVKDRMIELNKTINWKPASTGTGRFGNWLENMVDWNLSRSRFWGTPLPIWRTEDDTTHYSQSNPPDINNVKKPTYEICVGSKNELIECIRENNNIRDTFKGFFIDLTKINNNIELLKSILNRWEENYDYDKTDPSSYVYTKELYSLIGLNQKITLKSLVNANLKSTHLIDFLQCITERDLENIDLHKPTIDNIIFCTQEGEILIRVPDLIDVWFDSGAMPYAQWGLPEKRQNLNPTKAECLAFWNSKQGSSNLGNAWEGADFIAEGVDQTRGWFYTLHALGVLLFDSVAYKTVVSNGLVLDKNGNKMSKRIGNVVDPFETLDKFGPDATRWYLVTNASPWDSLKFDVEGIKEVQRKFFGTLYNTYQFFALYANVDGFVFSEEIIPLEQRTEMDRWILSSLNTLIQSVSQSMDDYEPTQAGRYIEKFVDEQLSNWYVRLCRRRFWKGEYEHDKISAYQTLYECLDTISRLIAPLAPFFADWLFANLNEVTHCSRLDSVHHTDFPVTEFAAIDVSLENRMQMAQEISSLILSLRKKVNIKVRQPLQRALVPSIDPQFAENIKLVEDIIKSETNVKKLEILSAEDNFIRKKARANFKTLGKKLGPKMKWAAEEIQKLGNTEIEALQKGNLILNRDFQEKNEKPVYISLEDIEITTDEIPGFEVSSKGALTVALDITLNMALKMEGEAREFVNKIQHIRKDNNLEVTDKIFVKVSENESLKASFTQFNKYICAEILAEKIDFVSEILDGISIDVNEITLKVKVIKKGDHNGKE